MYESCYQFLRNTFESVNFAKKKISHQSARILIRQKKMATF